MAESPVTPFNSGGAIATISDEQGGVVRESGTCPNTEPPTGVKLSGDNTEPGADEIGDYLSRSICVSPCCSPNCGNSSCSCCIIGAPNCHKRIHVYVLAHVKPCRASQATSLNGVINDCWCLLNDCGCSMWHHCLHMLHAVWDCSARTRRALR